jgi:hypothetical protein
MTSEEINHMPPLEIGKTTTNELKRPRGIPMSSDTKTFQKISLESNQKQQIGFENLEEREQQNKKEGL